MFIYLIKKIQIPSGNKLQSLAWNPEHGWIACGGENGLLKVLKLDSLGGKDGAKGTRGVAAASNLSMNQTLEGHNGAVMCVTWNAPYRKLTSSDQKGLIIVWMMHKGMWLEEMINNRNKSVVRDMKWTADGQKICIVYEDGAVIVGSVDGNRLWGKELDMGLRLVEWSPDARHIVFVTRESGVFLYDSMGNKTRDVKLPVLDQHMTSDEREDARVVGLHWYDGAEGSADSQAPVLAIAFQNGKVQLSRAVDDDQPCIIDSRLSQLTQCKWNTSGTILAVAGQPALEGEGGRAYSVVNFYDAYGNFLRTLRVPQDPGGSGVTALSWEGSGLRLALAVGLNIYFANIRADYKWACCGCKTLVYAYNKPERQDSTIVFWDLFTDTRHTKYIRNVKAIRAAGEHVAYVLANGDRCTTVSLCNTIGVSVETKDVPMAVTFVAMTASHVVLASERVVYVWQYRSIVARSWDGLGATVASIASSGLSAGVPLVRKAVDREKMLDVDDTSGNPAQSVEGFRLGRSEGDFEDPICAITASDKCLLVARQSGILQQYGLPTISREEHRAVPGTPILLHLNCNSSRLCAVDANGILNLLDLHAASSADEAKGTGETGLLPFERKDVWDVRWADDNPDSFAVMEKTRLNVYTFREEPTKASADRPVDDGGTPLAPPDAASATVTGLGAQPMLEGEPIQCSGYLGYFENLEMRTFLLDEVLANADAPDKDNAYFDVETKPLKDLRDFITSKGLEEAFQHVSEHPHPRLWQLLAEAALEALNLPIAEQALVKAGDYQGIQYIKRIRALGDRMKQRADVAVYFGRIDEAEAIYREIDRKDLAIGLRERVGDWSRVVHLVQNGGGDDKMLAQAWNKIGDYYADKFKWSKAAQYYSQSKNFERVAMCYFRMEDYDALERLIGVVPYGNRDFLLELGHMLQTVGMDDAAVECYLKANEPKMAIDCCVLLNHWERAVALAEEHNFPQIEGLLPKQVSEYLEKGDRFKAIELFRKANRATDAAQLLAGMAEEMGRRQANSLRAKKLQVLAAFEVERFRKKVLDVTLQAMTNKSGTIAQTTAQTLDNLMTVDRESGKSKVLDNAWRGAAAYHYQLLAHRQLYNGDNNAAMKTAIRLAELEDVLSPRDVYSVIALTAYNCRHFGICSRAFIKLETLPAGTWTQAELQSLQSLAVAIFTQNPPYDPAPLPNEYVRCLETGTPYHACTVTGRAVQDARTYMCRTCRHYSIEAELRPYRHCPLCHSVLH